MASKGQKKARRNKEVVVVKGNTNVRDCMTWHYQDGYAPSHSGTPQPGADFHLPSKVGLGQAKDRGYEMPPPIYRSPEDDGKVIDALRGWPHHGIDELCYDDNMDMYNNSGAPGEKRGGDPYMGELIGNKFGNDAIRKRVDQENAEARKTATKGRKSNPGDIKGNRTSQLRTIALAEKVDVNPQDLWQMSRFKKNARPHLSTVSKRTQDKSGKLEPGSAVQNGYGDATGNGDPCTCYRDDPGLFDGGRADSVDHYDGPTNNNLDSYDNYLKAEYGEDQDDKQLFAV